MTNIETPDDLRIIRLAELLRMVSLSRSTVYLWIQAGTFPAPVKLGARAIGWRAADVRAWLVARQGGAR